MACHLKEGEGKQVTLKKDAYWCRKKGELLLNGKRQIVARQKICKVVLNLDPAAATGDKGPLCSRGSFAGKQGRNVSLRTGVHGYII